MAEGRQTTMKNEIEDSKTWWRWKYSEEGESLLARISPMCVRVWDVDTGRGGSGGANYELEKPYTHVLHHFKGGEASGIRSWVWTNFKEKKVKLEGRRSTCDVQIRFRIILGLGIVHYKPSFGLGSGLKLAIKK